MSPETYEKAAVVLRYVFAAAGVFITLRAAYMAVKDGYKASKIRQGELKYGAVAVMSVYPADRRGKPQKMPIGRNGCVGSGLKSDIRIRGMGLKSRHFDYEINASRMYIFSLGEGDVQLLGKRADEESAQRLELAPGEKILAGRAMISFAMLKTPNGSVSPMNSKVYRSKGKRR